MGIKENLKLVHGTDDRRKDRLWRWANRVGACFLAAVSCVLAAVALCVILDEEPFSPLKALLLLCAATALIGLGVGISDFVWRNGRYCLTEKGITLAYPFRTREIAWADVKSICLAPVDIVRSPSARDYLLIRLTDAPSHPEQSGLRLNLSACRRQRRAYLAIRSSEARIRELSRYWSKEIVRTGGR